MNSTKHKEKAIKLQWNLQSKNIQKSFFNFSSCFYDNVTRFLYFHSLWNCHTLCISTRDGLLCRSFASQNYVVKIILIIQLYTFLLPSLLSLLLCIFLYIYSPLSSCDTARGSGTSLVGTLNMVEYLIKCTPYLH